MIVGMRLVIVAVSSLVVGILISGSWMLLHEDNYIYFPDRTIVTTPDRLELNYAELHLRSSDGIPLQAWWMPATRPIGTLLHLHGNAGNISHRIPLYSEWHRMGLNVLAIEYRGYGESDGAPSEDGLYLDAEAAWQYLTATRHIPPSRIIIAGRSLGAAVACHLAKGKLPAGVVLETPFSSMADMARYHYPWLPVWPFIRSRFDSAAMIMDVQAPLLIISATDDVIAPPAMADAIFSAARQPKQAVSLQGDHNDFDDVSQQQWRDAWQQWLTTLPGLKEKKIN